MRSSLFSSDSSKLLPSAVRDSVTFTSAVWLTAGAWFCWGLQWQGPRLGAAGATMVPAASLWPGSASCKRVGVCVEMGLQHASVAGPVAVWGGRDEGWSEMLRPLLPACAVATGQGGNAGLATPLEASLPSWERGWCDPGERLWVPLFVLTLLLPASSLTGPTAFLPERLSCPGWTCTVQARYWCAAVLGKALPCKGTWCISRAALAAEQLLQWNDVFLLL